MAIRAPQRRGSFGSHHRRSQALLARRQTSQPRRKSGPSRANHVGTCRPGPARIRNPRGSHKKNRFPPLCPVQPRHRAGLLRSGGPGRADQGGHITRTQPTQAQMQPVADEVGEADSQRVRRVKIGVAVGADDRQPPLAGSRARPEAAGSCSRRPSAGRPRPAAAVGNARPRPARRRQHRTAGTGHRPRPRGGRPVDEPGDRIGHGRSVDLSQVTARTRWRPFRAG